MTPALFVPVVLAILEDLAGPVTVVSSVGLRGSEDTDFGQLADSHRVALTWVGGAWAYHQHHPGADPSVHHLHNIILNASVFCQRWGWWPMSGWLTEFERRGLIVFEHRPQTWQAVST